MSRVVEVFRELKVSRAYRVSKVLMDSLLDRVFKDRKDSKELKEFKV